MSPPIEVALLALPQSTAATLFGIYDILASVRRDWSLVHGPLHAARAAEVTSLWRLGKKKPA